jgi:cyclophilin family peptidyl-prolyl cis-trans isomerase
MKFRGYCIVFLALLLRGAQAMVQLNRRTCWEILQMMPLLNWVSTPPSFASDLTSETQPRLPIMPDDVVITDKVFIDVRIARKDGSTYVRDDLDDSFENTVLFQSIKIGLYGKIAPNHVEKFLNYIDAPKNVNVEELLDNPYPSYSRSTFPSLDQETGLLMGGNIPSLRVKDVAGTTALTYGNRVLPAPLWVDRSGTDRISHSTAGLLTHRNLEVLPTFGITTRSQPSLDATHTVFGQVLWNEDTLKFFRDLEDIPTYSVERPSGFDDFNTREVATTVYNAQREFFRGAAKTFGDDRVSKLYNGKLLRRMEVLQVGRL